MTTYQTARQIGAGCVATLLAVYVVAGFLLGLLILGLLWLSWLGLISMLGSLLVGAGLVYVRRHRYVLAGFALIVGGILVGGSLGVWTAAYEYDTVGALALGFVVGAVIVGSPPIATGIGLLCWRA